MLCIAAGQPLALVGAVQFLVSDMRRCEEVLYDDARALLALVPIAAVGFCVLGNRRERAGHDGAIINTALALSLQIVLLVTTSGAAALLLTPRCADFMLEAVRWTDIVGPIDLIAVPLGVCVIAAIVRAPPAVTTRTELVAFATLAAVSVAAATGVLHLIGADRQSWASLGCCC